MVLLLLLTPIDWMVTAALLGSELLGRSWRKFSPAHVPSFPLCRQECSFVIVSWHGKKMLQQSLAALSRAIEHHGGNHEVIVVLDHESNDGSRELVQTQFPRTMLLQAQRSLYFGAATRLGVQNSNRDIVVLLNNDTVVEENFLGPLLAPFGDELVFGVASHVHSAEGAETGKTRAYFGAGDMNWVHDPVDAQNNGEETCRVSWLHRGAVALDRRKYDWLGGFDPLYDPFFFEDADLSYRAWAAGWKCLLALNSHVTHQHEFRSPPQGEEFLRLIALRNAHIFFWKNIHDFRMLAGRGWASLARRMRRWRTSGMDPRTEWRSLISALKRSPAILRKRLADSRWRARSDRELLEMVSKQNHRLASAPPKSASLTGVVGNADQ